MIAFGLRMLHLEMIGHPFVDVMSPFFTLEDELYTLDIEHFEDDVTRVVIMLMVGPTPSLGHPGTMI
jgi:hypothetical protein